MRFIIHFYYFGFKNHCLFSQFRMSEIEKVLILWKSDTFPHRGNFFVRIYNNPDKITYVEGYMARPEIMVN